MTQEPGVPHGATYHTLCLPGILESADDFHMADKNKASLDAMASGALAPPPDNLVVAWGLQDQH